MLTTVRSTLASALGLGGGQSVAAAGGAGDSTTVVPPPPESVATAIPVADTGNVVAHAAGVPVIGPDAAPPSVTVRPLKSIGAFAAWPVTVGGVTGSMPRSCTVILSPAPPATWTTSPGRICGV